MNTGTVISQKNTAPFRVYTFTHLANHSRIITRTACWVLIERLVNSLRKPYRHIHNWLSDGKTLVRHLSEQVCTACRNTSVKGANIFRQLCAPGVETCSHLKAWVRQLSGQVFAPVRMIADRTESLRRITETCIRYRFAC